MARRTKNPVDSSDKSSSESDASDDSYNARKKVASPKRKRGRPPTTNKRQRLQDDSDDDVTNQPSTSHNGNNVDEESESDSRSETPDSDYEHVMLDRSVKKKTVQKKRGRPFKATGRKPQNNVNSSNKIQKRSPSSSNRKLSKSPACNGVAFDPVLVEALAHKCVYFLLIEDQKKYAIKRKAIVTHVFKDEDYSAKLYLAVIKKANIILKKIYGMELIELENQKDSYLIVNILRKELGIHDYVELSRLKQQQHGLILYLVTVIYMNDNTITETELTSSLKLLGIDLTSKRLHPIFGDVKKYITVELVKQMYLNYECVSKEPPKYEFTWGLRAKQEFGKMDLLQFACKIMNDTSPEDWKIQYKDAEKSVKPTTEVE